jgi:PKD repeat protein
MKKHLKMAFIAIAIATLFLVLTIECASADSPPVAVLPSKSYTCDEGQGINFALDASASYDPEGNSLHYRWDIGNTGTWQPWSTNPKISFYRTFTVDTTILIKLKVSDGLQESTAVTATLTITVTNLPPTVNAGSDMQTYVGKPVQFSGSYSDPGGSIATAQWDFGDGQSQSGTLYPTHTYTTAGNKVVKLTVTDRKGLSASDELNVMVLSLPAVELCDNAGHSKSYFIFHDKVFVKGAYLPPNVEMPIYVIQHISMWTDGLSLSSMHWMAGATGHTDASGSMGPTLLWEPTLTNGYYDVFVDVNNNRVYDASIDYFINVNLDNLPPGLLVLPEGPLGALLPLGTCFAIALAIGLFRRK